MTPSLSQYNVLVNRTKQAPSLFMASLLPVLEHSDLLALLPVAMVPVLPSRLVDSKGRLSLQSY